MPVTVVVVARWKLGDVEKVDSLSKSSLGGDSVGAEVTVRGGSGGGGGAAAAAAAA